MTIWTLDEIKQALGDILLKAPEVKNPKINQVSIDSRKVSNNSLFVAIKGENNDGHDFLNQAFANGAVLSLVEKIPAEFDKDPRLVLVKNSLNALSKLAFYSRSRTKAKIIAVTGSVGKTSVKEMLKLAFSSQGKVFANEGNLNNHFGLPLSLANLPLDCDYGIFEMGMNHLREIEPLSKIARPDIAVITNVGSAHIGNFNSEDEIALAKSEIFSGVVKNGYVVVNSDNKYFDYLKSRAASYGIDDSKIISFGSNGISNIRLLTIENFAKNKLKAEVKINDHEKPISYVVNTVNQSVIFNSLIVAACLKLSGLDVNLGLRKLEDLEVTGGRGNLIEVKKDDIDLVIIDDSYNANPSSMIAGIKFLADLKPNYPQSRTIAIIGDMLELGKFSDESHKEVAQYLTQCKIDGVILVGKEMKNLLGILDHKKILGHFDNSLFASDQIFNYLQNGDLILVKGSRGMAMEKIINKIKG